MAFRPLLYDRPHPQYGRHVNEPDPQGRRTRLGEQRVGAQEVLRRPHPHRRSPRLRAGLPRRVHRERGPARDRFLPRGRNVGSAVGGGRLHPGLRGTDAVHRCVLGPGGCEPGVRARRRRLHARLGGLRSGAEPAGPDRRAGGAGSGGGRRAAGLAGAGAAGLRGSGEKGPRGGPVGGGRFGGGGAGSGGGRCADHGLGLARDLLRQPSRRCADPRAAAPGPALGTPPGAAGPARPGDGGGGARRR